MSDHVQKKSGGVHYMSKDLEHRQAGNTTLTPATQPAPSQQDPAPAAAAVPPEDAKDATNTSPSKENIPETTRPSWCRWDPNSHAHSSQRNVIALDVVPPHASNDDFPVYQWAVVGQGSRVTAGLVLLTAYRPDMAPPAHTNGVGNVWSLTDDVGIVFMLERDTGVVRAHRMSKSSGDSTMHLPKEIVFTNIPPEEDVTLFAHGTVLPQLQLITLSPQDRCQTPDSSQMQALGKANGELRHQLSYMKNALDELHRQRFLKKSPAQIQVLQNKTQEASMVEMLKKQMKVLKQENEHLKNGASQWSHERMSDLNATLRLRDKEHTELLNTNKQMRLAQRNNEKRTAKPWEVVIGEKDVTEVHAEEEIRRLEAYLVKLEKEADRNRKAWDQQQQHIDRLSNTMTDAEEKERQVKEIERLKSRLEFLVNEDDANRRKMSILKKVGPSEIQKRERIQSDHKSTLEFLRTQISKTQKEIEKRDVIIAENNARKPPSALPPLDPAQPPAGVRSGTSSENSTPRYVSNNGTTSPTPNTSVGGGTTGTKDASFWAGLRNGQGAAGSNNNNGARSPAPASEAASPRYEDDLEPSTSPKTVKNVK